LVLSALVCTGAVSVACGDGSISSAGGSAAGGSPGGEGGMGATSGAGNWTGTGGSGSIPIFETDIVPLFNKSCGAGDNSCHTRKAYGASFEFGCRGWLALEDTALGSKFYDGPTEGQDTGCPDMPLFERLTQLNGWNECTSGGKRYVVPCDVDGSFLFDMVDDGPYCTMDDKQMPTDEDLPANDKEMLRVWIELGAPRLDGTVVDCGGGGGGDGGGGGGGGAGEPPVPAISHPSDGETRTAGVPFPFIGAATDPEDGDLMGGSLVWTSNLDGQIGTGETFDAALSVGMHTVSLTATDSDGNSAADSLMLNMTP